MATQDMKIAEVTPKQGKELVSMANAKGVSREQFQRGLSDGTIAYVLDVLKEGGTIQRGDWTETGELVIPIPALARPTEAEIKKLGFKGIEADNSPIEATTLRLGTVLKPGEEAIDGTEYERRRVPLVGRLQGYQHAQWLVAHQEWLVEQDEMLLIFQSLRTPSNTAIQK